MRTRGAVFTDYEKDLIVMYAIDAIDNDLPVKDGAKKYMEESNSGGRSLDSILAHYNNYLRKDPAYRDAIDEAFRKREHRGFNSTRRKTKDNPERPVEIVQGVLEEIEEVVTPRQVMETTIESARETIESSLEPIEMTQTQFAEFVSNHIRIVDDSVVELRRQIEALTEQRDRERQRVQELLADKDNLQYRVQELKDDNDAFIKAFSRAREFVDGVPTQNKMQIVVNRGEVVAIKG